MAARLDVASIIPRDLARKPPPAENSLGPNWHPARAWRRFAELGPDAVPPPLAEVVERAIALARREPD